MKPERLEQAIITGKELTEDEVKYLEEPSVPRLLLHELQLIVLVVRYTPKVVRGHA